MADDLEEDVRADDGKSISDDDRNDLSEEQVRLTVEQAVSTSRVDFRRSPEARGNRAPGTADAVHTESIERIIIAELLFEDGDSEVADDTTDKTNGESRHRLYEASCWRDGDKAGNAAGSRTEDGRLAIAVPLDEYPGDRCSSSSCLRRDECVCGKAVRAESRAGIEAEPAEPEESCAEDRHRQVVRQHRELAVAAALAEQDADRQAGYTGEDVDDEAAGEVKCAELREEAAAPYPVCHRVVDEDGPEQDQDRKGCEAHALCKRAGNQGRRDDGEHALERDECELRDGAVLEDVEADTGKADLVEAADEAIDIRAERHGITEDDPLNGDHRDDEETLHDGRQDVLAADHAAVEERETRCHDEDQGCADEHPGRIASVNHKNPFLSISSIVPRGCIDWKI